jgi:hypothetical protein
MMDSIYHSLNKKLDTLQKHEPHNDNNKKATKHTFHTRVVNMTHIKFNNDEINTLNLGFENAVEKNPKQFINTIIETENAIRHLDITM